MNAGVNVAIGRAAEVGVELDHHPLVPVSRFVGESREVRGPLIGPGGGGEVAGTGARQLSAEDLGDLSLQGRAFLDFRPGALEGFSVAGMVGGAKIQAFAPETVDVAV